MSHSGQASLLHQGFWGEGCEAELLSPRMRNPPGPDPPAVAEVQLPELGPGPRPKPLAAESNP